MERFFTTILRMAYMQKKYKIIVKKHFKHYINKKSEYNNELNMKTDDNNVIIEKAKDLFGDINVN